MTETCRSCGSTRRGCDLNKRLNPKVWARLHRSPR